MKRSGRIRWDRVKAVPGFPCAALADADTGRIAIYFVLICIGFVYLEPILEMIAKAMMSAADIIDPSVTWIPKKFSFDNLSVAAGVLNLKETLKNSVLFSGGLAAAQTIGSAMTAYALSRYDFKGKKLWFVMIILTFIMPVLLMLLLFLKQYSIFSQDSQKPADLFNQLVQICKTRLTLGHFVMLGVLLFVAYIFVGRSGHTGGVPVPAIEIKLRLFLEEVMYARPREKEFLIGHPAFFLAVLAAYRMAPNWCKLALVLGAVIGQGSLVQTFCHMRTPAMMSYIRAADGYLLGSVLGIIAVIAVSIIMPYIKPWLRRFSVNE